jgi:polyhydroxyalkanoate synthesis regulator phasin
VRREFRACRLAAIAAALLPLPASAEVYYLIVGGIGGEPEYTEQFAGQVESLAAAARRTIGEASRIHVLSGEAATSDALRERLADLAETTVAADRLAVFLLGHGSFDGEQYKLNLSGPDIDDAELVVLLDLVPARTQLIVNATSASGAALEKWAAEGRTLITATRSGAERNATRFGEYWAAALSSAEADLNKNGTISAQEAFDFADRMVTDSYEEEGALATEHPQLAGDGAAAFEVARLTARRLDSPELVALNEQLAGLEEEIAALRLRREELGDDYLPQLQTLLVELSRVQQQIDTAEGN